MQKYFSFLLVGLSFFIQTSYADEMQHRNLKILHLSFHQGCVNDFKAVEKELGLDVTSWYVLESEQSRKTFDPQAPGNSIYNISHDRAERVWRLNKEYFDSFDVILTSDTAPLSRIFVQNGWKKPLWIWICNRFDYYDGASSDGRFPDAEYYELFKRAFHMPNVKVIGYTAYEHFYATQKGVHTGTRLIKPCGAVGEMKSDFKSAIPAHIAKENSLFMTPRLEPRKAEHIAKICKSLAIPFYCGQYNGPNDLKEFKAVLHFPYAWSNVALFENIQHGLPHFVPSIRFLHALSQSSDRDSYYFFALQHLELCEWYRPENREILTYFDSWQDLKHKVATMNYPAMREKIKAFGKKHKADMLQRWSDLLEEAGKYLNK